MAYAARHADPSNLFDFIFRRLHGGAYRTASIQRTIISSILEESAMLRRLVSLSIFVFMVGCLTSTA